MHVSDCKVGGLPISDFAKDVAFVARAALLLGLSTKGDGRNVFNAVLLIEVWCGRNLNFSSVELRKIMVTA